MKSAIDLKFFFTPHGSISLLYGPRQIGKTASLKLFLAKVEDCDTIIFTDCSAILHRADLYNHLKKLISGKTTIVLDEVQEVERWHLALRSLYSEDLLKLCRIWCTGSEARYLLESGERLPGRKGEGGMIFARPWSFREYMDFFYENETKPYREVHYKHVTQLWLAEQRISWNKMWEEYCISGGFPRAVGEYRQLGTITDMTYRIYVDWILGSWSKMRTPERSLSALARRLRETLNSRVSYESLKKGTDIQSANTVRALMEIQEDRFSLRCIARYDPQKEKFLPSKLRKVYPLDPFIARVWGALGDNIRRQYHESLPPLFLDECAFQTQTLRRSAELETSYLYSEASKSEIDFYFDGCGFELKSNGKPTPKQTELLNQCDQAFVLIRDKIPLMAYLVGEKRA